MERRKNGLNLKPVNILGRTRDNYVDRDIIFKLTIYYKHTHN